MQVSLNYNHFKKYKNLFILKYHSFTNLNYIFNLHGFDVNIALGILSQNFFVTYEGIGGLGNILLIP